MSYALPPRNKPDNTILALVVFTFIAGLIVNTLPRL